MYTNLPLDYLEKWDTLQEKSVPFFYIYIRTLISDSAHILRFLLQLEADQFPVLYSSLKELT